MGSILNGIDLSTPYNQICADEHCSEAEVTPCLKDHILKLILCMTGAARADAQGGICAPTF